jgi:hypothetical protein
MILSPDATVRGAAAAAMCAALAACSSGSHSAPDDARPTRPAPTAYTADGLPCDADEASLSAQDTIERIGGRVEDDFTVRFSMSTQVGIVALVTGDTQKAFDSLHRQFGVAIVAHVERAKDPGRIASFAQISRLVASVCG